MSKPHDPRHRHARSSRQRYKHFIRDYRDRRLDARTDEASGKRLIAEGVKAETGQPEEKKPAMLGGKRREYLREYLRWLWPHRYGVAILFVLALIGTGLQMIEPLFMRFIIDRVLLNTALDTATRLNRLNLAGFTFLSVIILSSLVGILRDYRQRLLNTQVMLSLRRSLFDRLLHLPLPKLWDMKTGGILSRLTGDVDTTTGLLQGAVVSPTISFIRLFIAIGVLLTLNWRLAIMGILVIPGAMIMSFVFARRIRPIYRTVRKDVEEIDGRVGETFSGIRVVRAFGREKRELLDYMRGRHTVLRKELFAQRRELLLWTGWGLLVSSVNVVITWFGGYLNIVASASIGDIMAFQWYMFLLLNPVWSIVNSFSELQRSLAAMERVFEVLGMPADKPDRPDARLAPRIVDEIALENVEFEYREGRPVVRDFSVTVPGGSVVALVGRSGAARRPSQTLWRASTIRHRDGLW
jgi:ATP-binding cassette subfamily B protein/subfamily B ATP-binding cassette protein MsbA